MLSTKRAETGPCGSVRHDPARPYTEDVGGSNPSPPTTVTMSDGRPAVRSDRWVACSERRRPLTIRPEVGVAGETSGARGDPSTAASRGRRLPAPSPEGPLYGRHAASMRGFHATRGFRARLPCPDADVLPFRPPREWLPGAQRAEIAQLVEHATENRGVASSILALGTTDEPGRPGDIERKWLSW